ncbi:hypothetical protein D3C84_616700 [compost metagenome]
MQGAHEKRQGHGQRQQTDHAGRHAPGAEQFVRGQANQDRPEQPGQLERSRNDRRADLAHRRHLFEDDHRPPQQNRVARRLEHEVRQPQHQHGAVAQDFLQRLPHADFALRVSLFGGQLRFRLHRRQADVFRFVALENKKQHGDQPNHRRTGNERRMPAADERVRPPTGKRRGYQTAKGVAGTPQAQYPSALLGGKEAAEVLAQPRPTGGLRQALYQHAGSENR